MSNPCKVDFYVLASAEQSAKHIACRLAMKAWEQGHRVMVLPPDENEATLLDGIMWDFPAGRFLPHSRENAQADTPVCIGVHGVEIPDGRDVVINLSDLPVSEPGRFKRLLEIVRGEKTSAEVLATVVKLARTIRKVGVVSGVCFGFIGNRMLEGYAREVGLMLLEGAAPERIDAIVQDFGFPMGPNAMMDMAGIDVRAKVIGEARELGILPDDARYEAVTLRLAADGRHGQKTGAGIFRYEPGNRAPIPEPSVTKLIGQEATRLGVTQREHSDEEILDRCLLPLINEGSRILEEGIAFRPGDIDIVWLYGYGFPPFRGGPMHYADAVGLTKILARMQEFADRDGDPHGYWRPSALLEKLAADGGNFASWRG